MDNRTRIVIYLRASFTASILLAGVGAFVSTNVEALATSEPHTAAAVIAVDQEWSKAEDTGDAKYLNALLLPEYRSISSDGSTHDKATIIADAIRSARTPEGTAKTEKWLMAHPNVPVVQIHGDLAHSDVHPPKRTQSETRNVLRHLPISRRALARAVLAAYGSWKMI